MSQVDFVVDNENKNLSNDVKEISSQNEKSVECKLKSVYEKIAATEANILLFETLKSMNLATHDVRNFVVKQSNQKRISCPPDLRVQRNAMHSKLSDACAFAKRLRRERDVLKKRLSKKTQNPSNTTENSQFSPVAKGNLLRE